MTDDVNSESSAAVPEDVLRPKKPRAKKTAATPKLKAQQKEPPARRSERTASAKPQKAAAKSRKTEPAAKKAAKNPSSERSGRLTRKSAAKSSQALAPEGSSSPSSPGVSPVSAASKTTPKKKSPARRKSKATEEAAKTAPELQITLIEDPIGDVSDGEARIYTGELPDTDAESEAYRAGVAEDAIDGTFESPGMEITVGEAAQTEPAKPAEVHARKRERNDQAAVRPPAKLERLQKILSQAGIASRRHAEEMIVAGRIAVNGQVVTALGSKADLEHDHIRVDGKLLHGAERRRYFVLNKPKAYVTTVSDPQGRPTVMEFVSKLGERVYPVGRLDFQSEGLLLMTNDGALANQLTRASSGVEKTYLVKVSGQPDEEELERLRNGVMIERGDPSSSGLYGAGGRVRTAPAQIRQIRPGENPWYEVVLTEGRNREIRKMFNAVGHYVEKIRRVGYGPLVLDIEPGQLRELTLEEVDLLRQVAEGKLKPRRLKIEAMIPKDAGRTADSRPEKRGSWRPSDARPSRPQGKGRPERGRSGEFRGREPRRGGGEEFRPRKEEGFAPRGGSQRDFRGANREWQPRPRAEQPARAGSLSPAGLPASHSPASHSPASHSDDTRRPFPRPREAQTRKPSFGKPDFRRRSEAPAGKPNFRPRSESRTNKPDFGRSSGARTGKPDFRRSESQSGKPNFRARSAARTEKPRFGRRSEAPAGKPNFGSRSETRTDKPDFARRSETQFQKPEDREFRNRPDRPGARWQSGPAQRPFRPEGRAVPGSGGQSRPDAPAKFAPKGRSGSRYPQRGKPDLRRGKPEDAGREHSGGEHNRGRDRFSSNRKPGAFRTGPRPGGHRPSGPRPGGHRPGGKRRG